MFVCVCEYIVISSNDLGIYMPWEKNAMQKWKTKSLSVSWLPFIFIRQPAIYSYILNGVTFTFAIHQNGAIKKYVWILNRTGVDWFIYEYFGSVEGNNVSHRISCAPFSSRRSVYIRYNRMEAWGAWGIERATARINVRVEGTSQMRKSQCEVVDIAGNSEKLFDRLSDTLALHGHFRFCVIFHLI